MKKTGKRIYGCPNCGKRLSIYGPDEFRPVWEAARAKMPNQGRGRFWKYFTQVEKYYHDVPTKPWVICERLHDNWHVWYVNDMKELNAQDAMEAQPAVPIRQPVFDDEVEELAK